MSWILDVLTHRSHPGRAGEPEGVQHLVSAAGRLICLLATTAMVSSPDRSHRRLED